MRRIIVLHTEPSSDRSVPAASKGMPAGEYILSTLEEGSPKLKAVRDRSDLRIEAPSFDVRLVEAGRRRPVGGEGVTAES